MHFKGHFGIALLGLSPFLHIFLQAGRPILALLACGVLVTERIPDQDLQIKSVTHRGISHSLLMVFLVGWLYSRIGWAVATYVTVPFADWLSTTGFDILTGITVRLAALDPSTFEAVGWWVGCGGILLHLAGDVITRSGIQPFLPFSQYEVALTPMYAKNRVANALFFVLGWLAIAWVFFTVLGLHVFWFNVRCCRQLVDDKKRRDFELVHVLSNLLVHSSLYSLLSPTDGCWQGRHRLSSLRRTVVKPLYIVPTAWRFRSSASNESPGMPLG